MDTRRVLEHAVPAPVLSVSFNHNNSYFAVGLDNGFRIYETASCSLSLSRDFGGGIGMVQMLGNTNILGLVGGGRQTKLSRNKLILWDDKNKKQGGVINASTSVRGANMSNKRIVLVLVDRVQVYQTAKPHPLLSTYETTDNPLGLCCLSSERIAFPGRTVGHVQLVEISTGNVSIIPAHTSALRAMALSQDGELLATASEMGTIIRVHATSNGAKLLELRRGIDKAVIFSLAFSPSGRYLACTSDKSTLHVFNVLRPTGGTTGRPITSGNSGTVTVGPYEASVTGNSNRPSSPHSVASSSGYGGYGGYGGGSVMVGGAGSSSADTIAFSSSSDDGNTRKWGFLSKLPFVPRAFSDAYSFASAKFEMADEPPVGGGSIGGSLGPGSSGWSGPPLKGNLGWISETELVVIGAGRDPKWEKFAIREGGGGGGQQNGGYPTAATGGGGGGGGGGGKQLVRVGWKRYGGETA